MANVRKIVEDRLKELKWSRYRLAKELAGKVSRQTVYNFLAKRSAINSDNIGPLLDALGLEIRPKR
jgi:hypothetical protein